MADRITETLKNVARGWKHCSTPCLPCEFRVRDLFPLSIPYSERDARWCLFLIYSGLTRDGEVWLGEWDSRQEAEAAGRRFRKRLERYYDAA